MTEILLGVVVVCLFAVIGLHEVDPKNWTSGEERVWTRNEGGPGMAGGWFPGGKNGQEAEAARFGI